MVALQGLGAIDEAELVTMSLPLPVTSEHTHAKNAYKEASSSTKIVQQGLISRGIL